MKVIHTMAGGAVGGAETAYVDTLIAQAEFGMEVIAACRPNETRVSKLKNAGIPIYEFPFGGMLDFKTSKGLKALIEKEQPDIVQCWMSRAAKLTPKVKNCVKLARFGGYYNLKYYKNVDHFIGNTPDICRWLAEDQGMGANKVTHINNFADIEAIETPVNRGDLDTPENAFVFLCLGRLHKVKGYDTALAALQNVPDVIVWIAGEGPEKDYLHKLAKDLGVSDRVRWLGWRNDRAALLQASNALLFPSRYEGFGTPIVQTWAAKRPLVTTASQGPSQYVTHGVNGLITPIEDSDALAHSMNMVANDTHLARKLVRNGFIQFEQEFKRKHIIKNYDNLYNSLKNLI